MTPSLGDGRVVSRIKDFSEGIVGACLDGNPLAAWDIEAAGGVSAVWSGSVPGDETGVRTWGAGAWDGFRAWCDGMEPRLAAAGASVWVRPHARHVLSDAQRCFTFLRGREAGRVGLLLDPVSMLTGPMLADAADHLERIFEALSGLPGTRALLLSPCEGGAPEVGVGSSLRRLVALHWPAAKPVVLNGAGAESLLGGGEP